MGIPGKHINLKINEQYLKKEYLENNRTTYEIADLLGCTRNTISYYLKKYNIPLRKSVFIKGHQHSKKVILQIRNKLRGRPINAGSFKKGLTPWNKGILGEESHSYKGNTPYLETVRHLSKYQLWKSIILERDNYTCRLCNSTLILQVHHIFPLIKIIKQYNLKTLKQANECKFLWDIDNGLTLCKKCHTKIHRSDINV